MNAYSRSTSSPLSSEQVESYESNGFLVLENYFSQTEVDILLGELPKLFSEDSPKRILEKSGAVRTVFAAHTTNEVYHCFSRLRRLVDVAKQLLKTEVYIHQFKINAKVALEGDLWEWHQDFLYWAKEDGMPTPRVLTAAVFLQEVNEFNGPMLVIPGSHKEALVDIRPAPKYLPRQNGLQNDQSAGDPPWMSTLTADLKYKINKEILSRLVSKNSIYSVKGRSGFLLLFHGSLFHASATNLSPYDRMSVFVTYNSVENKLRRVEKPRPAFIASPNFTPVVPIHDGALLELSELNRGKNER